jgi:signal transduction histidine kinase
MRDRSRLIDWLVAAGLLVWALPDVPWWWRPPGHAAATPVVLGYVVLALAQSVPFVWRRRWPLPVAGIAAAALAITGALGQTPYAADAAVAVAAYGLGAYGTRRVRVVARTMTAGALVAAAVVLFTSHGERGNALPLAVLATALGLGEGSSAHRDTAAATARLAHDQERTRFARELHDVIAHQLSAIAVQAGAARLASTTDPMAAARVVATIEQTARQCLIELNRLVGALRHDDSDQLDRAPQQQLCDLPDLVAGARDAGLPVELVIAGQPQELPVTIELAGYRVVQESLTNALRYAGRAPTRVRVTYTTEGLDLQVDDDGPPVSPAGALNGGGHGLTGLSERATLLGGHLNAGPKAPHGFSVHVWLPTEP